MALQTRSKKIAATQAALNSRTGRGVGAALAAPATSVATTSTYSWMSARMANIALIIAGVAVSIWGLYIPARWSDPSPVVIGSWGRDHWFSLILLWGIAAALIALNAEKATAKTLQWVLAGVVAAVLVVFPLWGLATSPSTTIAQQQVQLEMPTLTMPAGVGEESKRIPVPYMKKVVMTGEDFRFHCVYGDGSEESFLPGKEPPCRDGDLPFVYATNLKNEENVVAYAYAGP